MQIDPNAIKWDNPRPQPSLPQAAQPQPPRGPVFGPAPVPKQPDPAEQQRLQFEAERIRLARDKMQQDSEQKAPSGYRYTADGNLEVIPGGPADRARDGGTVPVAAADRAREKVSQFTALQRSLNTFQDDFAGNTVTGELENTANAYLGLGTPGQSEWWADFRATDNLIRNSLFGASLTEGEKTAYNQTTIQPGMTPAKVRQNLQRRAEIVQRAIAREKEFYLANGYKPEAVEALFAVDGLTPQAQQGGRDQRDTPPAFGAGIAPSGPGGGNGGGGTDTPPRFADLRPGAGLSNGDELQQPDVVTSATRREDNPLLAGVRQEYAKRLAQGQTAEEIIKWARSAGISPTAFRSIQAQVKFRDENPNVPIEQYDTTQLDDRFVQTGSVEQAAGQALMNPVGTFVANAGNAVTAFTLPEIIGGLGGNSERADLMFGVAQQQNPVAGTLGTVAGGVGAALTAEAGLARAGIQQGVTRALTADIGYGAAAGAGSAEDGNRLQGALSGATLAAIGSAGGQVVGNSLRSAARGTSNPNINALREAGVTDLTMGQIAGQGGRVGQAAKGIEDRLSGLPVIGDVVNARRMAGMRQFNAAAFNKALEPIGGSVTGKVGQEAIADAQAQVGQAFQKALSGKGAQADEVFARDLSAAVTGLRSVPRVGGEVSDSVADIMRPYADDVLLSGEALDDISRGLRDLKASYKGDPLGNRVGKQIDRVERAVFDLFDRQASGTIPDYMAARQAYRRLSILEDAVLKAQNQSDNLFTPAQLGQAAKANTKKFGGKRAAARGDMPFNDLQRAGQEVLPNRVPDSGTAGRFLVPLAAVGGGAGVDQASGGSGTGLTIGLILAGAYSRTGQRILTKPSRGMAPNSRVRAVLENPRTARSLGALGGASGAALSGPQ